MAGPDRVVVVGGGLAAARVLEELRAQGATGTLTLVSDETRAPYDRPPLSKDVLRGDRESTDLRADWSSLPVDLRLGERAVALDPARRSVLLSSGESLPYDALAVTTGAVPRRLPGVAGPGAHVLRTLDDALALRADITSTGRLTIVGGGFIGCEVAASARALGADVTLVESLPAPLTGVLGADVAAEVAALHERHGVQLRCGESVVECRGEGGSRELLLADGSVVPAATVLVGLGVRPETGWLTGSGLDVDDGVLCGPTGRTSVAGVWAAGDVAAWRDPVTGVPRRREHWTSAADQGGVVARDMLGLAAPGGEAEVPYFWSDQYDLKFQMLGHPHPDDEVALFRVGPGADRLLALYGREDKLTGVFGGSAGRAVMRLRSAVAAGADYSEMLRSVEGARAGGVSGHGIT